VGVEHHRRRGSAPAHGADDVACFIDRDLVVAEYCQLVAHERRRSALVARKALDSNQALQKIDAGRKIGRRRHVSEWPV
jgi:hypothetical protein